MPVLSRVIIFLSVCGALYVTPPAHAAGECPGVPYFIAMYGQWQSVAVRAEPASLLEENTNWSTPHSIVGTPTPVCPGISFVVTRLIGSETVQSSLTYVYDAKLDRSFGVIAGDDGARLLGEIRHTPDKDELTLVDFAGNVVWRETHVWSSPDEFISEGVQNPEDGGGRVWFRTWRVGAPSQ